MFAPPAPACRGAYMGRKRNFSNAFTSCATIDCWSCPQSFFRVAVTLEGAAPHLLRPMYAEANIDWGTRPESKTAVGGNVALVCSRLE
jgi:hypothetical protein